MESSRKKTMYIWTNEPHYFRIFTEMKRAWKSRKYFLKWNRWEIEWKDVKESKIFTYQDYYYILQLKQK